MKSLFISLLLVIILCSCKDENAVAPVVNPFADSTNIKFISFSGMVEVWHEGQQIGGTKIIDFNGNCKYYEIYCGKRYYEDFVYKLANQFSKEQSFLDSLDNIFIKSNFKDYQNYLPFGLDSTDISLEPCGNITIRWRFNKHDSFKFVTIEDCWRTREGDEAGKFPDNYEDFRLKLDSLLADITF
jgi:hypothetical protein